MTANLRHLDTKDGISDWSPLRELGRLDLLRGRHRENIVIQKYPDVRNPMFESECQVTFASLLILEILSRVHIQGCRKFWCGLEALNNQHCANWSSGHLEMLWNFMKCCLKEWSLCFCFFWLNQMKESRFQDSRSASIAFSTKICWIFPFMIHIRILSRKIAISKDRSPNQPATEQVMIWGLLPSTRLQIVASIPFMFSSWRIGRQFRRIICPLLFLLLPL